MKKLTVLAALLATGVSVTVHARNTYVGASLGIQNMSGDNSHARNFVPRFYIGYGSMAADDFYLAAELTAAFVKNMDNTSCVREENVKTSSAFILSILPGMVLNNDTLGYFRIGAAMTRFSVQSTTRYGFVIGPGVEVAISPAASIRAEYNYAEYGALNVGGKPRADEFYLSYKYTFDD